MSDWYDKGMEYLFAELTSEVDTDSHPGKIVRDVYSYLSAIGLIDYDIEKEVIYGRYFDDE